MLLGRKTQTVRKLSTGQQPVKAGSAPPEVHSESRNGGSTVESFNFGGVLSCTGIIGLNSTYTGCLFVIVLHHNNSISVI